MKKIIAAFVCLVSSAHAADFPANVAGLYRNEALSFQNDGRLLEARNGWYKYLRFCELESGLVTAGERTRLNAWMGEAESRLWPVVLPEPVRVPVPVEKPVTRAPRLSAQELLKKAELLQANGQMEEALRLYRLAEEAAPAAPEIKEKIKQLEAEMN